MSSIDAAAIAAFRTELDGQFLLPGESGYDQARRLWNGMIDRHPAAIVQCTGFADAASAIRFAKAQQLPLTVKSGGHGVAGKAVCDGGLMIDCLPMRSIEIDPRRKTARAGGGVTWGELDTATRKHGLATTGGVVASTGIAGLTLGGGIGFLVRTHGYSCDNLISAEVVTADGKFITASATENPDLFWSLNGGSGNFGVVTPFTFQLHEVDQVLGGIISFPFSDASSIVNHDRAATFNARDELKVDLGFGTGPHGAPVVNLVVFNNGSREQAECDIRKRRECGHAVADTVTWTTYLDMQLLFAETFPHGTLNYWKSNFLAELSADAIETMIARFAAIPAPHLAVNLEHIGGSAARIDPGSTAFSERDSSTT